VATIPVIGKKQVVYQLNRKLPRERLFGDRFTGIQAINPSEEEEEMQNLKKVCKYIVLAQTASEGGKGVVYGKGNLHNANAAGYALKDAYIAQAIEAARGVRGVRISGGNGGGMSIIYFDILGVGQVSFHSFKEWKLPICGKWNEKVGGSVETCLKLSKKFNLQY